MPKIRPKKETIIEDGWYPAEIGQVEERETKFGEKLLVPFEVDASGDTIAIDAWLSLSDHPKSHLVKWAKQLFGDREFHTDEFAGLRCEVFVEEGEDSEGSPKNFIRKLRPAMKGKGKPKQHEDIGIDESDFEDIEL
jgi:hypothetical protein